MADSLYGITGGGTGAKVAEALVHLCAAGLAPRTVHILIVDADTTNGNVRRAQATADAAALLLATIGPVLRSSSAAAGPAGGAGAAEPPAATRGVARVRGAPVGLGRGPPLPAGALALCHLATLYPWWQATRLDPVEIIRSE